MRRWNAERTSRIVAIATLVVPLVLFAGASWLSYRDTRAQGEARLERTLDLLYEHAQRVFDTKRLTTAAIHEMLEPLSNEQIKAEEHKISLRLRRLVEKMPQIDDVWVLDEQGQPLVAAGVFPMPPGLSYADRPYFPAHRERGEAVHITEILRGRLKDIEFFQYSERRQRADGSFAGVIAISIHPKYFTQLYAGLADGDDGFTASIVRADGAMLARHPAVEGSRRLSPATGFMRSIATAPRGGRYTTPSSGIDGVGRIFGYRRLPGLPIYVIVGVSLDNIREAWLHKMSQHLVFGVPATLGLFLLALAAANRAGRVSATLGQLQDEVRRRELAEDSLRQSQKTEAIGQLTAGIAHDFNNLLTGIGGALDLVGRRLKEPGADVTRFIGIAKASVERAGALTQRLLAFSRQQPLEIQSIDANRLVAGMAELLRRTLGEKVEVEPVLAGGLWRAKADPAQLESAILNLALNARDAMPEGGRLTIETANVRLDDAYAAAHTEVIAGQYIMVAVTDTGTGMDGATIERAADPFFTTKHRGQGTGLGLSMVYGYIKQSGGHMKIYSEVGAGTVVKLYLPRNTAEGDDGKGEAKPPLVGAAGCVALLVEDDPVVREIAVSALRELGCAVHEAGDAKSALAILDAHPEIVLLFTDIGLPGAMNGRQLGIEAQKRRPDLKTLYTTGYTANAIVHDGIVDPGVDFIGKPFSVEVLAAKLRSMGF